VQSTRVVSATEIEATLNIDSAAALALYDIRVTNSNGRSGKGSDLFTVVEKGARGQAGCTVEPLDASRFELATTLNSAVAGQPRFKMGFGADVAARETTLTYPGGARAVVVVAVGTNAEAGGRIEIFFVDPSTGLVLDGTSLVGGGPVQPHVTVDVSTIATTFAPTSLAVGDVNGDGLPDFIASHPFAAHYVALAIAHRSPTGIVSYGLVQVPPPAEKLRFGLALAMGDLDGDGDDEIAVSKSNVQQGKKRELAAVHLYDYTAGSLVRTQSITQPGTNSQYGSDLSIGDVTGDALTDLVVGHDGWSVAGLGEAGAVLVYPGNGAGPLLVGTTPYILTGPSPQSGQHFGRRVATSDLDRDASATGDILALDGATGGDVFPGTIASSGQTSSPALRIEPRSGLSRGWATRGASVGDVNGDGLLDVVVGAPNAPDSGCADSIGIAYLFLAQGTVETGTTGWTRYSLQAPSAESTFAAFGWSQAVLSGRSLLIIGEHGRDIAGVNLAGQVYIYKVKP
jgi:hypothetical protein